MNCCVSWGLGIRSRISPPPGSKASSSLKLLSPLLSATVVFTAFARDYGCRAAALTAPRLAAFFDGDAGDEERSDGVGPPQAGIFARPTSRCRSLVPGGLRDNLSG